MGKRVQLALALGFGASICVLGCWVFAHREPVYQGKGVSEWLEGYRLEVGTPPLERPEWQRADRAIRHLGTKAIPTLLRSLRARDEPWELPLVRFANKLPFVRIHYVYAAERNYSAAMAFGCLRTVASNSVPALVNIYMENRSEVSQVDVVIALGEIGPAAAKAVPCLLEAATNSDFNIRCNALTALGEIHARPELVVPVLVKALHSPDDFSRGQAAEALGAFKADGMPAVPALQKAFKVEKGEVAINLEAAALRHIKAAAEADVR
jgi:hypothetical protein